MPKKIEKPRPKWAERLIRLRLSTGKSQREFVKETKSTIGISEGTIFRLETGDLPLSEEVKLKYANYFHCPPEYITGEDDCPYTGMKRALMLLLEDENSELNFQSALRTLILRDIPREKIYLLAAKGLIDEDRLFKEAYTHMIAFIQEELRKAEEKDEHPDELPGPMADIARNAAEMLAPVRKLQEVTVAPMRTAVEQFDAIRRAAERAENKKAPDSPRPVEKSPKR